MLVADYSITDRSHILALVDGKYDSSRVATYQSRTCLDAHAIEPCTDPAVEALVFDCECIRIVSSTTAEILDTLQTPEIVTAWYWPVADWAQREGDEVARAIAAVDEASLDRPLDIGLVRAVLVGFVAEDARLTVLRLQI